jgi:hypothetical protein
MRTGKPFSEEEFKKDFEQSQKKQKKQRELMDDEHDPE